MEWNIAPHSRVDLHVFSGINFSGERRLSSIHPAGGLQKSRLKNFKFRSIAIVGHPGTRLTLCTSVLDIGWETRPWRSMVILKSDGYRMKDGKLAIRIPDLDWLDKGSAHRTDPDFQQTFPQVESLEGATGWTYGHSGSLSLNDNIKQIRIDRPK